MGFSFIIYTLFFNTTIKKEPLTLNQNSIILAFGDSITKGFGVDEHENYPYLLSNILNIKVVNSGASGEVSAQGLARLPKELEKVKPALVILCYGGNDILKKYNLDITKNNLTKMIELIQNSGSKVILIGVPKLEGFFINNAKFYDELAKEYSLVYDGKTVEEILKSPSLKVDQIHPNKKGHELLAKQLKKLIHDNFIIQN